MPGEPVPGTLLHAMIRNLNIGLYFILFALSGIMLYKAFVTPVNNIIYQNNTNGYKSRELLSASENIPEQNTGDQTVDSNFVKELQTTITSLEDKITEINKEAVAHIETGKSEKIARVLAVLGTGAFRPGLDETNQDLIDSVAEIVPDLLASPGHHIIIEGHTDSSPVTPSPRKLYRDNTELSFLRAKVVADELVKEGVSQDLISIIGYGDTRPVASNETNAGRIKNRRVEIKLISLK